ncbi:hypothetical protein ACLMJK_002030 [Lecanora helva]
MKRFREEHPEDLPSPKRLRIPEFDRLSVLSDELLLKALSYLSVPDLVCCERDPQLWKSLFYNRFVRRRASRIPGIRDQETWAKSLLYSSRLSKWLDDDHLVKRGKATNWKRQYKLRHNWSRGSARISETTVAEQPSTPPLLLRLRDDVVVVADAVTGLRAWALKSNDNLIASVTSLPGTPTALALDETDTMAPVLNISIGFDDGSFALYTLIREKRRLILKYIHAPSTEGAVQAIAYSSPHLLTMTGESLLLVYRAQCGSTGPGKDDPGPPKLVSSLRSHTAYSPISLAIRTTPASIIASIAYAVPTWTEGWSVGLQEVRLTVEGTMVDSRMASSTTGLFTNFRSRPTGAGLSPLNSQNTFLCSSRKWIPPITKPTSLSYNHPYLLSAHADNTLTLYLVMSNAEELSVGPGDRLWGHTSSVADAQVGERGKAVSVGALGDELRVWELEGGLSTSASQKRAAAGEVSVQVRPERVTISQDLMANSQVGKSLTSATQSTSALQYSLEESNITKGWVAFDEEKVVLLREKLRGSQAVVVYDFS